MLRRVQHFTTSLDTKGQNAIEYILVFVLVLGVFIVALAPGGKINTAVNESLDLSVQAIENVARNVWP